MQRILYHTNGYNLAIDTKNIEKTKKIVDAAPHLKDFMPFLDAYNIESPRGKVLIACNFLDRALRDIILSHMLDVKEAHKLLGDENNTFAPLSSFVSRSTTAFALGLISEVEFKEIGTIAKIRNRFAHDIDISFENQRIISFCNNLGIPSKMSIDIIPNPIVKFSTSSTCLMLELIKRPSIIAQKRQSYTYGDWKQTS